MSGRWCSRWGRDLLGPIRRSTCAQGIDSIPSHWSLYHASQLCRHVIPGSGDRAGPRRRPKPCKSERMEPDGIQEAERRAAEKHPDPAAVPGDPARGDRARRSTTSTGTTTSRGSTWTWSPASRCSARSTSTIGHRVAELHASRSSRERRRRRPTAHCCMRAHRGALGQRRLTPGPRVRRRAGPTGQRYCMNSAAMRFIPVERLRKRDMDSTCPYFRASRRKTRRTNRRFSLQDVGAACAALALLSTPQQREQAGSVPPARCRV